MHAIVIDEPGPSSTLRWAEVSDPALRPDDVLIRVRAAGVNRADLSFRRAAYGNATWGDSPLLGLEVAGEIAALGPRVQHWQVGDRVMAIVGGGGYAELARVHHGMLMRVPDDMDFTTAAAIPEAFVTAYEVLCHLANLQRGETVLIHAAGSGVGTAAVQLARRIGARVIASASRTKRDRLLALGVEHFIDRNAEDWVAVVRGMTGKRGADVVLDFIGASWLEKNVEILTEGGRLVLAGLIGGTENALFPLERVVLSHLRIYGTVMKSRPQAEKCAMVERFVAHASADFGSGQLSPVLDEVHPIERAQAAHDRIATNAGFGKVVLAVNS